MNRRKFIQSAGLGLPVVGILPAGIAGLLCSDNTAAAVQPEVAVLILEDWRGLGLKSRF
jgi:hypothetical protein